MLAGRRPNACAASAALQLKKVLSANAEATIHVECLMNDVDVSGAMTREAFEGLIQPLIDRIKTTCAKVRAHALLKP